MDNSTKKVFKTEKTLCEWLQGESVIGSDEGARDIRVVLEPRGCTRRSDCTLKLYKKVKSRVVYTVANKHDII